MAANAFAANIKVERLDTQKHPFQVGDIERVNLPYFDASNGLHWDSAELPPPDYQICPKPALVHAALARPRVDIWRCANGSAFLAGIAASGERRWVGDLVYLSGAHRFSLSMLGASTGGLVLSTLDVWSADTGKTLADAPVIYFPSAQRSVPKFGFNYAAAYRASSGDFFIYSPNGTGLDDKGGVYRVHAASNTWERLMPTATKLLAPIDVWNMQLDASGRYLLLGEQWGFRGTNWVRFAVFDLDKRRRVFEERHGKGTSCSEPRIVIGADGHIAFSYRSGAALGWEHVLIHYQIKPSK